MLHDGKQLPFPGVSRAREEMVQDVLAYVFGKLFNCFC